MRLGVDYIEVLHIILHATQAGVETWNLRNRDIISLCEISDGVEPGNGC